MTELVGAAGMGKTQACLSLVVSALASGYSSLLSSTDTEIQLPGVLYIDTERSFSPSRLLEIAQHRYPTVFHSHASLEKLSRSVIVYKPDSPRELKERLNMLEEDIITKNVQLIIIDSVAAPVRTAYGKQQLTERQTFLGSISSTLKYVGQRFQIPVVVTNQVSMRWSVKEKNNIRVAAAESSLSASLGVAWAHAVNTRYILDYVEDGAGLKKITVAKSPAHPCISWPYAIDQSGIVIHDTISVPIAGSVLTKSIISTG